VKQPIKFELVVNRDTAKRLHLKISDKLLALALRCARSKTASQSLVFCASTPKASAKHSLSRFGDSERGAVRLQGGASGSGGGSGNRPAT
jgi:hypothetical protein